jgi:hypothetical protein
MNQGFQPKLPDLLARFLNKTAQAQQEGLHDSAPEVTPYESNLAQPVDARLAWKEAVAAISYLVPGADVKQWPLPPHWSSLVASQEPHVAVAFCIGNFPQLVRDFHLILSKSKPAGLSSESARPVHAPALLDWAKQAAEQKHQANMLLALGTLRLARNFDTATAYVSENDAHIAPTWRAAWTNEKAALAWHQGRWEAARDIWSEMEPRVPVLFNRGMADRFLGNSAKGGAALNEAIAQLPETSAWHHLARLYVLLSATQ